MRETLVVKAPTLGRRVSIVSVEKENVYSRPNRINSRKTIRTMTDRALLMLRILFAGFVHTTSASIIRRTGTLPLHDLPRYKTNTLHG